MLPSVVVGEEEVAGECVSVCVYVNDVFVYLDDVCVCVCLS